MKKGFLLFVFAIAVTVLPAQSPIAVNDIFSVSENSVTFLPVTNNDAAGGGSVTVSIFAAPQHGTASVINGIQVVYTPTPFYFGTDSFLYIICTGSLCDTATVYINVSGTNAEPVATDDEFAFGDTVTSITLDVLANDYDVENDSFFVTSVADIDTGLSLGALSTTFSGEVLFTRQPLACGAETFRYIICNAAGCDSALVTITIICPDGVFLPQGFSPDGDGLNDQLVFTGLEHFAPAQLKVFNRYGSLVYDNDEYQNDWRGTSLESDRPLPDGTYFYVLTLSDKRKYNSYLVINR